MIAKRWNKRALLRNGGVAREMWYCNAIQKLRITGYKNRLLLALNEQRVMDTKVRVVFRGVSASFPVRKKQ